MKSSHIGQERLSLSWKPIGLATRLFVFFMLLTVTMCVGALGLSSSGLLSAKMEDNRKAIALELSQMSRRAEKQYGDISAQALWLSKRLSGSIEQRLRDIGLSTGDLYVRPDLLEKVLDAEYDALFFALERAKATGAFLILNATASRRAQEARIFRAGLFFKDWEPNILSTPSTTLYLRGISKIGQKHDMALDAQWAMEFDIEDAPYYSLPQKAAKENLAFLPRLYYWQPARALRGTDYRGMLCSVPLVDSNGNTFGVCGFEVSDTLFKLSYMPPGGVYNNISCVLAPMSKRTLNISEALFSWRYIMESEPKPSYELELSGAEKKGFSTYTQDNGDVFVGLHEPVNLYAKDSPFASDKYVMALLISEAEFDTVAAADNRRFLFFLLLLLSVGMFFSFFLSKWYIHPILKGFSVIRDIHTQNTENTPRKDALRVNIPEIDDLMEFLFTQNESANFQKAQENEARREAMDVKDSLEDVPEERSQFIEDMKLLTPTEKNVLDLYIEGRSAKEIADTLNLSVNTIKTHNRHIFMKLNVSSRNELLSCAREIKKHKS